MKDKGQPGPALYGKVEEHSRRGRGIRRRKKERTSVYFILCIFKMDIEDSSTDDVLLLVLLHPVDIPGVAASALVLIVVVVMLGRSSTLHLVGNVDSVALPLCVFIVAGCCCYHSILGELRFEFFFSP